MRKIYESNRNTAIFGLLGLVVMVVILAFYSQKSEAGLFDSAMTSGWEDRKNDHKYKLESYGFDVRVYEWTPKDNKNVRCVFVAGNENSSGVACYDVEKDKERE